MKNAAKASKEMRSVRSQRSMWRAPFTTISSAPSPISSATMSLNHFEWAAEPVMMSAWRGAKSARLRRRPKLTCAM